MAISAEFGDPGTRSLVEAWRAYALARLGDAAASRAQASECLTRTVRQGGGLGGPAARTALGIGDLWVGSVQSAADTLAAVAQLCQSSGDTLSALMAAPMAGQALVESGRLDEAASFLAGARRVAGSPIDNAWSMALAIYGEGLLAAGRGDIPGAEQSFHQALAIQHQQGFEADAAASLDALAVMAAESGRGLEAARLMGAAKALGARLELVRSMPRQVAWKAAEEALRKQLGGAADAALAEGVALNLDEAVSYARRARGARGRPHSGWDSLTPTELRVVACVADGLTNPDIGRKLFMSRPTVKTHLTHVFAKLDVRSRSELAAQAARRGGRGAPSASDT